VNTKKGKYFLYGLVVMCCLMYEVPIRSKKMKDDPAIVNLYKQTRISKKTEKTTKKGRARAIYKIK
jgi:hypothetical protein